MTDNDNDDDGIIYMPAPSPEIGDSNYFSSTVGVGVETPINNDEVEKCLQSEEDSSKSASFHEEAFETKVETEQYVNADGSSITVTTIL